VHRLDRLVSGLLIFAKNAERAERFRQQIEAGLLKKEYVAKVVGVFPDGEQTVDANVNFNAREGRSTVEIGGGAGKEANGKQALTRFQRICTDGTHSIVLCRPVTGRTHQEPVPVQKWHHQTQTIVRLIMATKMQKQMRVLIPIRCAQTVQISLQ